MRNFYVILLSNLILLGCVSPEIEEYENTYYVNHSLHDILLYKYSRHGSNIDTFTLKNGDSLYFWDYSSILFNIDSVLIIFDTTKMKIHINPSIMHNYYDRNLLILNNYFFKEDIFDYRRRGKFIYNNYYYTFTPQDYIEADTILK